MDQPEAATATGAELWRALRTGEKLAHISQMAVDAIYGKVYKIRAMIEGIPVDVMVDTGAELSAISKDCLQKLPRRRDRTKRAKRPIRMLLYDGSTASAGVTTNLRLELKTQAGENKAAPHELYVLGTQACDLILGMDFIQRFKLDVSTHDGTITMRTKRKSGRNSPRRAAVAIAGTVVCARSEELAKAGCTLLETEKDVIIPPKEETSVALKADALETHTTYVVRADPQLPLRHAAAVANTLARRSDDTLAVHVLNPGDEPLRIPAGTPLAISRTFEQETGGQLEPLPPEYQGTQDTQSKSSLQELADRTGFDVELLRSMVQISEVDSQRRVGERRKPTTEEVARQLRSCSGKEREELVRRHGDADAIDLMMATAAAVAESEEQRRRGEWLLHEPRAFTESPTERTKRRLEARPPRKGRPDNRPAQVKKEIPAAYHEDVPLPPGLKLGGADITEEQRRRLAEFAEEYWDVFAMRNGRPGRADVPPFKLITEPGKKVCIPARRCSPHEKKVMAKHIAQMLRDNILKPSTSSWSSPCSLVPKPGGGMRFVVDARAINAITVNTQNWPIPTVEDALQDFHGLQWVSVCDCAASFWAVEMDEESSHKTAIASPLGLFEHNVMIMGLQGSSSYFQKTVQSLLAGLPCARNYLDDLVIFTKGSFEQHMQDLRSVFDRLRHVGLQLKASKCDFARNSVNYLGFVVNRQGIQPDERKVHAVSAMEKPQTVKQLRQFLGVVSFYRKFCPKFAQTAHPLYQLLRKIANFKKDWGKEHDEAWAGLKTLLVNAPTLAHPNFDRPFIVTTDAATRKGIGAYLSQIQDGQEVPIAYISRSLKEGEQKWSTRECEALAIVYACKAWRPYLFQSDFTVRTDHKGLLTWLRCKSHTGRLARWALALAEYGEFQVEYIKGKDNIVADYLSRHPGEDQYPELRLGPKGPNNDEDYEDYVLAQEEARPRDDAETNPLLNQEGLDRDNVELFKATYFREQRCRAPGGANPPPATNTERAGKGSAKRDSRRRKRARQKANKNRNVSLGPRATPQPIPAFTAVRSGGNNDTAEANAVVEVPEWDAADLRFEKRERISPEDEEAIMRKASERMQKAVRQPGAMGAPLLDRLSARTLGPEQMKDKDVLRIMEALDNRNNNAPVLLPDKWGQQGRTAFMRELDKYLMVGGRLYRIWLPRGATRGPCPAREVMSDGDEVESPDGGPPRHTLYGDEPDQGGRPEVVSGQKEVLLAVVPCQLQQLVFDHLHEHPLCGHAGFATTLSRIQQRFWWPGMRKWIKKQAHGCAACCRHKWAKPHRHGLLQPYTYEEPWACANMDLFAVPRTREGYTEILSIMDMFTRYIILVPLKRADTESVVEAILEHLIYNHGVPREVLTDSGQPFFSKAMHRLWVRLGARQSFSSVYWAEGNGAIEGLHKWLRPTLAIYAENHQDWAKHLGALAFAHRSSPIDGLGVTPYELMHGRPCRLPLDVLTADNKEELFKVDLKTFQLDQLRRLDRAFKRVRIKQQVTKERNKRNYNKKHVHVEFRPGDLVLFWKGLRNTGQGSHKLTSRWSGPFICLEQLGKKSYRIRDPASGRTKKVVTGLLRAYRPARQDGAITVPPKKTFKEHDAKAIVRKKARCKVKRAVEEVKRAVRPNPDYEQAPPSEPYTVERITKERHTKARGREYLVKWAGFDGPTWEPEKNILDQSLVNTWRARCELLKARRLRRKEKKAEEEKLRAERQEQRTRRGKRNAARPARLR
jgi:hypothetical protein